jgi:anti-anti-sigma factor
MPAGSLFSLQITQSGPDIQVMMRGELDISAEPALTRALAELRDTGCGGLVLHMGEVEYIDCACARVIAQTTRTWPAPGRAVIRDPSPIVRRVFELSGLASAAGTDEPATLALDVMG